MAQVGEITVKVHADLTEASTQMLRGLIAEVVGESSGIAPFATKDELAAFVRAEVRKALDDLALATRMQAGIRKG